MTVKLKIEAEDMKALMREMETLLGLSSPTSSVVFPDKPLNVSPFSTPVMDALKAEIETSEPKRGRGRPKKETTDEPKGNGDDAGTDAPSEPVAEAGHEPVVEGHADDGSSTGGNPARSFQDVREKLLALSGKITPPKAMAFLKEVGGVAKLGEMKEEDFGAFYDAVEQELAK